MKGVNVCFRHYKSARLGIGRKLDVSVHVFRAVRDWYFELWLLVDGFAVLCLFRAVHQGFYDDLFLEEKQGRLDDVEEEALFRFQDEMERLRESKGKGMI